MDVSTLAALPLLAADDHWGHHWWPVWPLLWALVIGVIVWLVVRRRAWRHDPLDTARGVLAERYARGEISRDEYRERLGGLGGDRR
jgi:putative membrane protein